MKQEEYEIDDERPLNKGAKTVVDHFMSSDLKEADLAEYMDLKTELDALTDLVKAKRDVILEKCKGMESAKAGKYVAFLKTVKGRKSVKWEKFAKAMIGEIKDGDLEPYTEQGDDSIRIEVKKIG